MAHNIHLESQAGKGSDFYFELNFGFAPDNVRAGAANRGAQAQPVDCSALRVLLADDNS